MPHSQKNQNIKQEQYYNKFNKHFKNVHIKTKPNNLKKKRKEKKESLPGKNSVQKQKEWQKEVGLKYQVPTSGTEGKTNKGQYLGEETLVGLP